MHEDLYKIILSLIEKKIPHLPVKIILLTFTALTAFAANSVLCRLALGEELIDAGSFTAIRLLSGIIVLFILINFFKTSKKSAARGSWLSAVMLFIYAIAFSFAYKTLDAGTGALILFGSVQMTIITAAIISGERLSPSEAAGTGVAFTGFIYLMLPGVTAPSFTGFILMAAAGIGWGIYTLRGKGSVNPLADTASNFIRTMPFVIILLLISFYSGKLSAAGILLAVLSGGAASGLGYTVWYYALRGLTSVQSAVVQLLVPVIAAFGGVIFISEIISLRLIISSVLILGGILIVIFRRYYFVPSHSPVTKD